MELIYELHQVRKMYGGRMVLDIEHLQVRRGEVLAVVGPSGAGKSTLLRLLNFLEPPDHGIIHFQGQPVLPGNVPLSLRRQVTTVFQRPALLSTNVWKNAALGLELRGERGSRRKVDEMLKCLGLTHHSRAAAGSLSGGEAQRVALARALLVQPSVLLLDEPTANLDPYNVALIEQVIREFNQQQGTTIVLVTHHVFQAKRLAQRVALLLGGRIIEVAETQRFFESPCDARTKAFVQGEMVY
jgi:tungstate transport system ATP-binding protein